MADLLNIGLSGLRVSQSQLTITGHNIANVNTPGFSRQSATQATTLPQFSGSGYIGSGVALTDIRRSYSEFLTTQLRNTTSLSSDVGAYKSQIDQLDSLLSGTTTGVTPSLKSFFAALQTAAEDPANIPARDLVLSEADGLARRFNTIHDRLSAQNDSLNKQLSAVSDQVNRLAGSIASLNDSIAVAAANGQTPNDLLDAREEAIRQLSTYVGVSVVPQSDGTQSIFVGTGQPLVVGSSANRLEAVPGKGDPSRFEIEFVSGDSRQGVTTLLSGGELGGLIRYRSETLDSAMNSLGRLALAVSDQVNTQLGQGLDLKGQVGAALFGDFNDPALAALRVKAFSGNSNAQPAMNITDTSLLGTSDYQMDYDASATPPYKVRRLSDNQQMVVTDSTPSGTLSITDGDGRSQGFQISLGTPAPTTGDRFLLQPTRSASKDIAAVLDQADQLAFASPLHSEANVQNKGTGSIGQPSIDNVLQPMSQEHLAAISSITLNYTAGTPGTLSFSGLPAGVTITQPTSGNLSVNPGQTNELSYTVSVTTGTPATTQEYQITQSFSGRAETGDSFSLAVSTSGVSDNRNALKLVDLQSKATVAVDALSSGSGMSFSDGYGQLVERVGTLTAQARVDSEASTAILKQATDNRDSLSAVSLDEEAANLIKFEQYYNASSQVIQVARSLFDTLMSTFR
ncbi:flagellar hook-associated protein FlgK [Metapseudomonas furukawaii]|jgi:flagellar hook-associated protein 1 FlgK|uniref:Flagellar hook-associated protein 1 n=1 Tax=Metapseudomonas furukawaii TaxID=1149133 RepID=A0AAD1C417_METFU|nr:flagellar hook-associated protein FlgK [Pseudomonas furukawaii]BAU75723.1 flagellar hook-associated protein FlgK [Pseudomonas furukawaii]